jgi:hypothetical protein
MSKFKNNTTNKIITKKKAKMFYFNDFVFLFYKKKNTYQRNFLRKFLQHNQLDLIVVE